MNDGRWLMDNEGGSVGRVGGRMMMWTEFIRKWINQKRNKEAYPSNCLKQKVKKKRNERYVRMDKVGCTQRMTYTNHIDNLFHKFVCICKTE